MSGHGLHDFNPTDLDALIKRLYADLETLIEYPSAASTICCPACRQRLDVFILNNRMRYCLKCGHAASPDVSGRCDPEAPSPPKLTPPFTPEHPGQCHGRPSPSMRGHILHAVMLIISYVVAFFLTLLIFDHLSVTWR